MNTRSMIALFLTVCLATAAFGRRGVELKINYDNKEKCVYSIEYTSQGDFRQKGTTTKKKTGVNCILSARNADSNRVAVKIDRAVIRSDFYDEEKIAQIQKRLLKSTYSLTTENGYPAIDTGVKVPAEEYLEWDLYRQLIKLLPAVPDHTIKPGYKWEQWVTVPMQTSRGTIPCELYRFYTFKRLKRDTATIVWTFRYAPTDNAVDSTNALEAIPIGGKGSGSALIDVSDKCILKADMGFSTPIADVNGVKVTWRERAVFTLKYCK